jgi:small subunit ribosomal protein S17
MSTNNPAPGNQPSGNPAGNPAAGSRPAAHPDRPERNERKVMRGTVTSAKMQKTLVVQVDRKVRHPMYEKFVSRRTKLYAHDENGEARVGDVVEITRTRRYSKLKNWRLLRIVQKGAGQAPQQAAGQ